MSDIDTARLRAEIAEWRAVGFKTDDYPLDTVRLMRLLDRVDDLERAAAAAGRALREANEREAGDVLRELERDFARWHDDVSAAHPRADAYALGRIYALRDAHRLIKDRLERRDAAIAAKERTE